MEHYLRIFLTDEKMVKTEEQAQKNYELYRSEASLIDP